MPIYSGHYTSLLAESPRAPGRGESFQLAITGMTCGHCVGAVREALGELPGVDVRRVTVGAADIDLDLQTVSPAAVIEAIRGAGYQARFSDDPSTALPQMRSGTTCCSTR